MRLATGCLMVRPTGRTVLLLLLLLLFIRVLKLKYTPAARSTILSKLIFASCVRDTPIARITGCVSSLRI